MVAFIDILAAVDTATTGLARHRVPHANHLSSHVGDVNLTFKQLVSGLEAVKKYLQSNLSSWGAQAGLRGQGLGL
jgi:ribosomal protein L1